MELDKPSWASRSTLVKNHDENKTYILVKLSESFSNAIQEYSVAQNNNINNHHHLQQQQQHHHHSNHNNHHQKYNNNVKSKHYPLINNKEPTIKFQGTRGAIKFPDGKCYDFSLEQSDNSVECIKQTKTRWETVGKMGYCLQVKGKDDVYQMTKTKLKAAEQEKRKYCAKLLGSPEHNNTISNNNKKTKLLNSSNPTKQPPIIPQPSTTAATQHQQHHQQQQQQQSTQPPSQNHQPHHHRHHKHKQHSQSQQQQPPSSVTTNNNNNINNNNNSNSNNATYPPPYPHPPSTLLPQNKYPDIADVKQLKKYKAEFDKDYKEYQNLHGYLHRIEERFRKLRELLKQSVEGSPEWESAKEQIFNEYERVKSDSSFHIARGEYKKLCNKLAHIKEKIFQFKQRKKDLPVLKQQQQHPQPKQQQQPQQHQPQHNHHDDHQKQQPREQHQSQHQEQLQQHHHHSSSKKHQKHKHQKQQQRIQK